MDEVLSPSKGIPPSFGDRTSRHEDGENHLYLMMVTAKAEALLGKVGPHVGKALVKVGRSNDPSRRLKEINGGFPDIAVRRWELKCYQAFADGHTAHSYEIELKDEFEKLFVSRGKEFFAAMVMPSNAPFNPFALRGFPKS